MMTWLVVFFMVSLTLASGTMMDDPPMLTQYVDRRQFGKARTLSWRNSSDTAPLLSYTGFLTVNKELGNHMFFMLFPNDADLKQPLLLWLNKSPSVESVAAKAEKSAEKSRATFASMLFVDIPGAGYSFSCKGEGGLKSMKDNIEKGLFSFLKQFLKIYPIFYSRKIYIGGQSEEAKAIAQNMINSVISGMYQKRVDKKINNIYHLSGTLFDHEAHLQYLHSAGVMYFAKTIENRCAMKVHH